MTPTIPRAARRLLLGAACALLPLAHAAAAPAECVYTSLGKFPLRYSGPHLNVTTGGSINGVPGEMMLGSGFAETFLTRNSVARHNLKLRHSGLEAYVVGATRPIYEASVEQFAAGPVRAARSTLKVLEDFGDAYDAVLGAPFLFQTDLELSLATKEMTFFRPRNCENIHLGYWQENVDVIPFEPQDEGGLNPQFIVHINGQKMVAHINTNGGRSLILGKAAKRAGLVSDTFDAIAGDRTRKTRIATAASFQIGGQTMRNAEFLVIEPGVEDDGPEVILQADFLRAHRVLFAMSQKKLYFSRVDGASFGQQRKLEPWMQAEADQGNADAQLALANAYTEGWLLPRDEALAAAWLEKAAQGGSPYALLQSGKKLVVRRDYAAAVPRLRAALDKLPAERYAAFDLYIARVKTGQSELAKTELAAAFARTEGDEWPKPMADFYLGKLPLHKLLEGAAEDPTHGKERRCTALSFVGDWHRAHGQTEAAKLRDEQLKTTCSDTWQTYTNIGD